MDTFYRHIGVLIEGVPLYCFFQGSRCFSRDIETTLTFRDFTPANAPLGGRSP